MPPTAPMLRCRQLRRDLDRAPGLPSAELLSAQQVEQALGDRAARSRDRLYTPPVTLWAFLSQALDPDQSCRRAAVARFLARRAARGLAPCPADTGAYRRARSRLPEAAVARLAREAGRRAGREALAAWRWKGRSVEVADGTTVSVPDAPADRAAYPRLRSRRPGVGFPIARLVVPFSPAVGAALGPFRGAGTGEQAPFRAIRAALEGGDVLPADRGFGSLWDLAATRARGADVACRTHQSRTCDFRRGRRLGRGDHVVTWAGPPRPDRMDEACHAAMPASLTVREARLCVGRPGFRTRLLVVTTTLLDPGEYPRAELAALCRARWPAELDLRAPKATPRMGVLRGKTPDVVRKEVWAHLLGYNLVRGVVAEAASDAGLPPSDVSSAGALRSVNAFAAVLWSAGAAGRLVLTGRLRAAVARHRVGGRPDRCEPREKKRRPKPYPWLKEPRGARRLR